MTRKRLCIIGSLLTGVTALFVGLSSFGRVSLLSFANNEQYQMTLNSSNKVTSEEASANLATKNTALGNPIQFALNNTYYTSGSNFARVNENGYIRNQTPINGVQHISITIAYCDFDISFSNVYGTYSIHTETAYVADGETKSFEFDVDGYSYFSINSLSSRSMYVKTVNISFSCIEPAVPEDDYVEYTFLGEEKNDPGFGEGMIVAHKDDGFMTNDIVSFYWGNSGGKFDNYYPLGEVEVESSTTDVAINIDENVAIPANATKVIVELNNSNFASYDIPNSKRNNDTLLHKYATISDAHLNYTNGQKHVEEALNRFAQDDVEYVISSGDTGRDSSDFAKYENACRDSNFTGLIFASIGNHEYTETGPEIYKQHAIYDGSTKTFVSLEDAHDYFENTYNNPNLPVSVFYQDYEGEGNTHYYYATIANNLYIFMDQILENEGGTGTRDNFSEKQIDWLEDVISYYAGDHTGDVNFAYAKYNLNIIEHAPLEQFKEGDVFPAKYGGAMMISVMYPNINRFVEVLKEYTEAMFFNGHTHLMFDVGINHMDNYCNEYYQETNIPMAHNIHVPSVTQPRWYKPSGSMGMPNDFSNGSDAYYCYQYENSVVLEAHRLKEYNESKTTYDHNDYINKIFGQYSLIIKSETKEHSPLTPTFTDYAKAENGVVRAGSVSFEDTSNGLQVTFAASGNRFEIKTGDHSSEIGLDYDINFLFKSDSMTSITLGGCNYTGGRYTTISVNLTQSGAKYTVSDAGDGWKKVQISLDDLYNNNCGETFAIRFYDASTAGTFFIKNLYISNIEVAPTNNYRGEQFYYNRTFNKTVSEAGYKIVEFDYLILNDQSFSLSLISSDWSKYYGYFTFNNNGPVSSYDGIQYEHLSDGYVHITMICAQLNITNNESNRNKAPDAFDKFYIRGGSGIGLVDNFNFSMDDSHIVSYRGQRFDIGIDHNDESFNIPLSGTLNIDFHFLSGSDTYVEFVIGLNWTNWFGYYRVYGDGHLGDNYSGVSTGTCSDGYHRVSFDLTNLGSFGENTGNVTSLKLFYISSSRSTGEGFVDFNSTEEAIVYRGQMFSSGNDLTINEQNPVSCTTIEFDYYLLDDGCFNISFMDSSWANFYGNYEFNKTGAASSYAGITTQVLSDGYIHVVMTCSQLGITGNENNRNKVPGTISIIFIRGSWTTGNGYLDNITFH